MKISSAGLLTQGGSTRGLTPDFTIYTGAMEIDPEHKNIVRMIGSSTERDLHGDSMALSALTDMTKVEPGLSLWLNHSYDLPHDLFGSLQESPSLLLNNGIADLHIVSDVEESNPAAMQTLGYVRKGRRLGCSIGCLVLEAEIDEENDDTRGWFPPLIILHVLTLEYSIVGIPANQRSWVEPAAKGLFERMANDGCGDEALKLAPVVKGLYPRAYDDYLKKLNNEALRRDLERVEARPTAKQRIEWMPNEAQFAMNTKGIYKPMERKEVSEVLKDAAHGDFTAISLKTEQETVEPDEIKGASGKTSWPLADEDTAWDKGAAHKRIMDWAGGEDPDWSKVKSVHFWFDGEKDDTWGGYKLPFCDRIGGEIKAVPHAIYACTGGHGLSAADIPESDVPAIKKKIEVYYHRLGKKAPWEEKEDDKEDAVEPDKETDGTKEALDAIAEAEECYDQEHEALLTITADGTGTFTPPLALPSDVQLFNALAARFDQPQISLDDQGRVQATKAFPELSPEAVQDTIAKALEFGETIKSGSEFSAKNKKRLQDIHDGIVDMCKSQFHPCEEMADDDDDKKKPEDNDGDEDDKEKSAPTLDIKAEIAPLQAQITALIDTLAKHGIEPRAIKDLQGKIKDLQSQAREAEETLSKLKDMPLGQPTRLNRSVRTGEDIATYQDFARLSAPAMGDNERRWTLEEALKSTIVISRDLPDGGTLNYRKWPDGVGGSVKAGVRPELTGAQRQWMHPLDQLSYNDGNESSVPCYDDPCGIQA